MIKDYYLTYMQLSKLNCKRKTIQIRKDMHRHFAEEDIYIANKFMKSYSTSLAIAGAAAKSFQSCLTMCDPIDSSPPGSPIPGILQARTMEWVAISFSNAWKWKVKGKSLSYVRLLATPWTATYHAPSSMRFSRREYWSGVPLPFVCSGYSSLVWLFLLWLLKFV